MRILALLALFHFSPAHAGSRADGAAFSAWSSSNYSYCDMNILARHWGGTEYDAKIKVGRHLLKGKEMRVATALEEARTAAVAAQTLCPWMYTNFTYNDAEKLAAHWGTSVEEAKSRVELKVTAVGEIPVIHMLEALDMDEGHEHDVGAKPTTTTNLDSCHSKMLRHLWGMNAAEVQSYVDRKISDGYPEYIEQEIGEARTLASQSSRVACSFYDTPYTLNDAELLAARWSTTVTQAKAHVERKYIIGYESWLAEEVNAVRAH